MPSRLFDYLQVIPMNILGTFHTQDALLDRLITINLDYCDEETEIEILHRKHN